MANATLLAGYSRQDLTPEINTALAGYGDDSSRICEGILDRTYGTCIAITDEDGETALLYTVDMLYVNDVLTDQLRESVERETGIPGDHLMLCATHSHSTPSLSAVEIPGVKAYYDQFVRQMTIAAKEALEDRAPTEIYIGSIRTEKMNFVRHYLTDDGTYLGDNFGNKANRIVDHASPADEQLQLIRFVRDGTKDVVLINWQAHAKMSSTATSDFGKEHRRHLSADFIGYTRKHFEQETGLLCAYFTGAAGNLNADSRIQEETPTKDPAQLGAQVAKFACQGLKDMKKVDGGKVRIRHETLTIPIDHSDDGKVDIAREIWAIWPTDQTLCKERAIQAGFNSAYATRDVVRRFNAGESRQMTVNTITAGDIAFAAVPYEMFCGNGMYVKENSPYDMTFMLSCANGYHNYLPSEFAFTHGCYEVDSRQYPKGTAERVTEKLIKMLKEE